MDGVSLDFDDWYEYFGPILHADGGYLHYTLNTGLVAEVRETNYARIWTVFDDRTISNGIFSINRLGYAVTEKEYPLDWDRGSILVIDFDDLEYRAEMASLLEEFDGDDLIDYQGMQEDRLEDLRVLRSMQIKPLELFNRRVF